MLVLISNIGVLVLSFVRQCVEALDLECGKQRYGLHKVGNPNKCRNMLVHRLRPCVKVYQFIYRYLCERKVDYYTRFGQIRSRVGHIMSTPGFSIDEIVRQIDKVLKEYQCRTISSA